MKGKIVNKRNLTPDIQHTKSFSHSTDNHLTKYSKSFIELMQKAMTQIKNKQKQTKKFELRNNEKCMQTFVYGLFPNQQRRLNIKNRFIIRKSLDSIQAEEIQLKHFSFLGQNNGIQQKLADSNETLQALNSYRMKATFNIKARKSIRTEKGKFFQRKILKKEDELMGRNEISRKVSLISENYIEPWSINEEHEHSNKYFP